ncbi:hypothetical protein ColLi_11451 [Colletotrichum liriopes]|uniref:Uncharacterized protein n=1 Tax=Colletotrichum liriopes TaxID=708192 RepID=A0AA37GYY6_9PEZI|nr:hypothetical protein ColLi_11451 [Colletotrichum liriopes]
MSTTTCGHLPELDQLIHFKQSNRSQGFMISLKTPDYLGVLEACQELPTGTRLQQLKSDGSWDIADPKHRACTVAEPCFVTGEKSCARTTWLAKFNHTYRNCGSHTGSENHVLCRDFSDEDRHRYPLCSECGLIIEARHLVLIHQRILSEDGFLAQEDVKQLVASLEGYKRAGQIVLDRHMQSFQGKDGGTRLVSVGQGVAMEKEKLKLFVVGAGWWRALTARIMKGIRGVCQAAGLRG